MANRAADEARQLAVEHLYLYTPDQQHLYARLGWSVVERCQYRAQDVVIMELRLAA
ncbi:MAG: hypothetical protein GWN99_20570 [Gemmatimonadetes bacterium]|uniref:Uncharacterized protein n=1 Tax=Candidatus Kutchimonas denitrificans TaxID=3056748 RepID=A0AAE5CDW4_9BACT|nr:hypothetical protein [Gemmatimonadota bacterium]NIR76649.1 hypothetical protein [Candidatus Kutchimonas denitrificans]NIS03418.1 hypothetical protein [Gemmatimonadota bacterium]NIT69279.1 hypothetical protein [Gemmatimonadota bacterium]NIU54751.1 hypothetical protein [Gemmatimonadota bacterium]